MDLEAVIAELKSEGEKISRAIAVLMGLGGTQVVRKKKITAPRGATSKPKKRGGITPAGRRRLSIAMKKRWKERRKKGL